MDYQTTSDQDTPAVPRDRPRLAEQCGTYYRALLAAELPPDLAAQLVRDWHMAQVSEHPNYRLPYARAVS